MNDHFCVSPIVKEIVTTPLLHVYTTTLTIFQSPSIRFLSKFEVISITLRKKKRKREKEKKITTVHNSKSKAH